MGSSRVRSKDGLLDRLAGVRAWWGPVFGLGACLGLSALLPLSATKATDPPTWGPSRLQSVDGTIQDLELTLRARKALLKDDALAIQGLGVTVRSRVAILWGTVPSKDLAQRAEACLELVGLQGVRNELRVASENPSARPLVVQLPPRPSTQPTATPGQPTNPQPSSPPSQWAASGQQEVWRPVLDGSSSAYAPASPARPPSVAVPVQQKPGAESQPRQPEPAQPTARGSGPRADAADLAQAVESVRQQAQRFQLVQSQVAGRVVTLRAKANCRDALFELAGIISRLSGVERVVIEELPEHASR